jgi:hypothetical protein
VVKKPLVSDTVENVFPNVAPESLAADVRQGLRFAVAFMRLSVTRAPAA